MQYTIRDVRLCPDPAVTANIYCSGRLDRVIFHAIAPFWRELRSRDPEGRCLLWLMRYGKGGEHLKVRVHGPESLRPFLRESLEEKVTAFLDLLPEGARAPANRDRAPAIDVEDEDGDHPDRTFVWTSYRRSPVSLGGKPFLADDRYVALFTRCLSAGCERILALEPGAGGTLSHSIRQRTLLTALIAGLAALEYSAEKRADYLAYHRDWLLRFLLPVEESCEREPAERLHRHLDEQIARMGEALLPLRRNAESGWHGSGTEVSGKADWKRSLADLLGYVAPLCRDPGYRLDPFASDPVFAPVFKVLHGFANQLGLKRMDEAFAHHLLFRIAESSGSFQSQVA
jgi:hypothetical protein